MHGKSKKSSEKYDRQLRLWGAEGQKALSLSSVCALGSSVLIAETLKNLVLPGIQSFTIVDDSYVNPSDLGTNFFLQEDDIGRFRAKCLKKLLLELNDEDVVGESYICNVENLICEEGKKLKEITAEGGNPLEQEEREAEEEAFLERITNNGPKGNAKQLFFERFSVVVVCASTLVNKSSVEILENICTYTNVPLIICEAVGFFGVIRIYAHEHLIVGGSKDTANDLRIVDAFEELHEFVKNVNLSELDDVSHEHVPYIVILIKALEEYQKDKRIKETTYSEKHDDAASSCFFYPRTSKEKEMLKEIIRKMRRKEDEKNFIEAMDNAYRAFDLYEVNEDVVNILNLAANKRINSANSAKTCDLSSRFFKCQRKHELLSAKEEESKRKEEVRKQKNENQNHQADDHNNIVVSVQQDNKVAHSKRKNDPFCCCSSKQFFSKVERERYVSNFRFWIVAKGVSMYHEKFKKLPFSGFIPDMHSDTISYRKLQTIYRKKHEDDVAIVKTFVLQIIQNFLENAKISGKHADYCEADASSFFDDIISDKYLKNFCSNANNIKVMHYSSVYKQFNFATVDLLKNYIEMEGKDLINVYILHCAYNNFRFKYKRSPGAVLLQKSHITHGSENQDSFFAKKQTTLDADIKNEYMLFSIEVNKILSELNLTREILNIQNNHIEQIVRYCGLEIHVTCAFLGGVCSQECIKLISRRFIPLDNTFIYDGIHSISKCITLYDVDAFVCIIKFTFSFKYDLL